MTYLATEMLLYMLSTALIGFVLGGLIWGGGRRRQLASLRDDLTARLGSEKASHEKTMAALESADARMKQAVEAARTEAGRSLAGLQQTVDAERQQAQAAHEDLEQMRTDMQNAIQQGQASGQEAIDQAMREANIEKAAAAEAMAKEAQSRAQIEELRLLIGAEKLAAESARSELETMRAGMQAELENERHAHVQAKIALDDIRSTLARNFGPAAAGLTAGHDDTGQDRPDDVSPPPAANSGASPFSLMTDMAAAGEALNNPDLDEADIEDREDMRLDLSPTIDVQPEATPGPDVHDQIEVSGNPASPVPDRVELRPLPMKPVVSQRPATFLDRRPDLVDDLTAIDGITQEVEHRLQENGCYHYRQLAELTSSDIDWLAEAIDVGPHRIAADGWVQQAKRLLSETAAGADADADDDAAFIDSVDQQNAAN